MNAQPSPTAESASTEPFDAWSARLVRAPMGQGAADLICLRETSNEPAAESSQAAEAIRRKGRLGRVHEVNLFESAGIGPALTAAIMQVESPLVVISTSTAVWNKDIAERLFKAIDGADLVSGVRPLQGASAKWRRTLGALTRGWFWGAGVLDPLSPYLVARTEGLKRFPLQSRSRFALVEVVAKWNFLDGLIHEEMLPAAPPWVAPVYGLHLRADKRSLFHKPAFRHEPKCLEASPEIACNSDAENPAGNLEPPAAPAKRFDTSE